MSIRDREVEMAEAMHSAGIPITEPIIGDGILHRYHVFGDPRSARNAWAVLWVDDLPAGVFGCHKRFGGQSFKWSAEGTTSLSRDQLKALAAKVNSERDRREEHQRQARAAAALKARAIWDAAAPCEEHPYLRRKGVKSHGLRTGDWVKEFVVRETGKVLTTRIPGALLVPIHNESGEIVSLQAIFP
jgi:putative DNA primase/helicase